MALPNVWGVWGAMSGPPTQWMQAVGLDRNVQRRGLAVMAPVGPDRLVGARGVRVLKPIGPRFSGELRDLG